MDIADNLDEIPDLVEIPSSESKVIPVTILTGFLGSGKTTLLNHILTAYHGKKIAVIENEFSDGLGIEKMIAKNGVDGSDISGFFELNNGCICCSVKDDLLKTLEQLILHKSKFDYILIETTGVANPGPIISALWADEEMESSLRLDGVITIVDALNLEYYLKSNNTAKDVCVQIAFADRILLNKIDLVSQEQISSIESRIRQINALAEVRQTSFSNVSPDWVLDINGFSMKDISPLLMPQLNNRMNSCMPCGGSDPPPPPPPSSSSVCVSDSSSMKGSSLPAVMRAIAIENNDDQDQQQQQHSAVSLTTFGLTFPGYLNIHKLKVFLDNILYSPQELHGVASTVDASVNERSPTASEMTSNSEDKAMRIYRGKGILRVENEEKLYILQSVHEIFDIQPSTIRLCLGIQASETSSICSLVKMLQMNEYATTLSILSNSNGMQSIMWDGISGVGD
eukprot:gene1574-3045_t